ncbi:PIG-L family deacetylase [Engelhardtia mirabilis]|uniref:Mycothiol S-conjugate amidase n=1 Tax=Engelhardtia mirabilis TaxID=2528011 RepID=A0A518BT40_9BACT|nr:Mycothiol S-conjugate amidase [Planctomycetes bacterium Pla133]QDV04450.1 Mycothiol S-conjugate amidase [Planctomycetes bacterium Pla86]
MGGILDLLVVAAHPDDAELALGGVLAASHAAGRACGVVDLTRGERATRGNPERRIEEAQRAAEVLGLAMRDNLALPDGRLEATPEARERLAAVIRTWRPRLLVGHGAGDPHPDHDAAARLTREAWFLAGLAGPDGQPAHRPPRRLCFATPRGRRPDLVVPIDVTWLTKLEALRCHHSQVEPGADHRLGDPDPLREAEVFARSLGTLIGCEFAEGLLLDGPTTCVDPLLL